MIVYFHGLESKAGGTKQKFLEKRYSDVYAPQMNYKENSNLFNSTYEFLKDKNVKIISGSSMGGYFAYWMGKKLGVNTILFNPALPYRNSIDPIIDTTGNKNVKHHIILGFNDDIINPKDTIEWLNNNELDQNYKINFGSHDHRTPIDIFEKYFKKYYR